MPRKLALAVLARLATLVLLAGCSKKKLVVDPTFTVPEGTSSTQVQLITFFDAPNKKIRMRDFATIGKVDIGFGPGVFDSVGLVSSIEQYPPGTLRGFVLNKTGAEGMEIFRTDPNGGVRQLFDFAILPTRRWLDGGGELYEFVDTDPKRPANATYYARGLIGGQSGTNSPLSNPSRPAPLSLYNIRYFAERWGTRDGQRHQDADPLIVMQWASVPGASSYLIQVFQYQSRILSLEQRIATGTPAPLMVLSSHDVFVATVPGTVTEYKMGDPGATIFTQLPTALGAEYYVRISAINASGQMIGMTTGPDINSTRDLGFLFVWSPDKQVKDYFEDFSDPEVAGASPAAYLLYSRGAAWVSPGANPDVGGGLAAMTSRQ